MKLSKREKILICILGILVVGYLYYQFVYSVQMQKIDQKKEQEQQIENEYNDAINTINKMDDKKGEKKLLFTEVSDKSSMFYPVINQEHLILELNKLLADSNLKGQYKFNDIEVKDVDAMDKKKKSIPKSSLSDFARKYNNLEEGIPDNSRSLDKDSSSSDSSDNTNNSANKSSDSENNNTSSSGDNSQDSNNNKNSVEQMKCELTFNGSYSALNNFMNALSEYKRKIVVTNLNIAQKTLDQVNGTMNLEFYAVPKVDNELEQYLEWDSNESHGKESPFSEGSSVSDFVAQTNIKSDFSISVNSIDSVMPSVIIGKSNDSLKNTYVYGNKNGDENAEIVLTQDGENYYYKYKTSNGSYPENYSGKGKQFVPVSHNIILDIMSEIRSDSDDNSGLTLNVVNNTDKLVDVNIDGDDASDPRVTIQGKGSKVSVNNK